MIAMVSLCFVFAFSPQTAEPLDAAAARELAEKHFKLAQWCEKEKLRRRARLHALRSLSYDEKHAAAKKIADALKVEDDELVAPPSKKTEQSQAWKNFLGQHDALSQFRAGVEMKLAEKAKKSGQTEEEARILRRITYFAPQHAEARRRLDDAKAQRDALSGGKLGGGFSWRPAAAEKVVTGIRIEGPRSELSEQEKKIPFPVKAFQTEHFRLVTDLPDEFAKHYLRYAEMGFRWVRLSAPGLLSGEPERLRCVLTLGEENYRKALAAIGILNEEDLRVYQSRGTCRRDGWFLTSQRDLESLRTDRFLHNGAEWAMDAEQPWIREGLAYLATRELNESSNSSCFPVDRGSQARTDDSWRQEDAWRDLLLESVLLKQDPAAKIVGEAELKQLKGTAGVKAWSLLEYLRERDPKAFPEFLAQVRRAATPWDGLQKHYGLTAESLDEGWRAWVLRGF